MPGDRAESHDGGVVPLSGLRTLLGHRLIVFSGVVCCRVRTIPVGGTIGQAQDGLQDLKLVIVATATLDSISGSFYRVLSLGNTLGHRVCISDGPEQ